MKSCRLSCLWCGQQKTLHFPGLAWVWLLYDSSLLLPQERERGITINLAAVTFQWKQHQLNLIDTPGETLIA